MLQRSRISLAPAARDARIDVWRGVALLVIFANHIPGTRFEGAHRAVSLSDAAEVFVLLAGVSAAHAFWPRFSSGDAIGATMRAWTRAITIYGAHLVTIFAALALLASFAAGPWAMETYDVGALVTDPLPTLAALATLRRQLPYFDILPVYVVLLALLPGMLALARRSVSAMLGVSLGLYLSAHLVGVALPGAWFLDPLAWQLLFALGLAYGIGSRRGQRAPDHPALLAAAIALLVLGAAWKLSGASAPDGSLFGLGKRQLALPRIAHVVALAYVVARAPGLRALGRGPGWWAPVACVGRHALPVFCVGSLLSAAGYLLRDEWQHGATWFDLGYVALGIAAHLSLARFLEWRKRGFPAQRAAPPPAEASSPRLAA